MKIFYVLSASVTFGVFASIAPLPLAITFMMLSLGLAVAFICAIIDWV